MTDEEHPKRRKRRYGREACDQIVDEIDAFLATLELAPTKEEA